VGKLRVMAAIAATLLCGASSAPASPFGPLTEPWLRVDTPDFTLYGNGTPAALEALASELLGFREVVLLMLPGVQEAPGDQLTIFAYRSLASLDTYTLSEGSRGVLGLAIERPSRAWLEMAAHSQKERKWVGFQEFTHHLVARNSMRLPTWLNEGLAEYYATLRIDKAGNVVLGAPSMDRLRTLTAQFWPPLSTLLEAEGTHSTKKREVPFLYAVGWLFVHYLTHERRDLIPGLAQYIDAVRLGVAHVEAFEAAFGVHPDVFGEELLTYARGQRYRVVQFTLKEPLEQRQHRARPVPMTEIGAELAIAKAQSRGPSELVHKLADRVLKADPTNPRAQAAKAIRLLRANENQAAADLFEEAVDGAPDDALVQLWAARMADRAAWIEPDNPDVEWLPLAQERYYRAVTAAEWDVEAATALTWGRLRDPERLPEAIALLQKAMAQRPFHPRAARTLALAYIAIDRLDEAWRVHDLAVQPHASLEVIKKSREALAKAEHRRLHAWEKDGKAEQAAARCLELLARTDLADHHELLSDHCAD